MMRCEAAILAGAILFYGSSCGQDQGKPAGARGPLTLKIMAPSDGYQTVQEVAYLLGRTNPGVQVKVGDVAVEVYSTGGFARDGIPLQMGKNTIAVVATDATGQRVTRSVTVIRKEPQPEPPPSVLKVVEPAEDIVLLPGETLAIRAVGPPGGTGFATCLGSEAKLALTEARNDRGEPTGSYSATVKAPARGSGQAAMVTVSLRRAKNGPTMEAKSKGTVDVWDPSAVHVGECKDDRSGITLGLHSVRLGGPYLARIPRGVRFEIVGRQGANYRIRLSKSRTGWIPVDDVARLPEGTLVPHNYFTSCEVNGDEQHDRVTVPLLEKVVVAATSETEPLNKLYLDFFNTHDALTWISHKTGARVVGTITGEQMEDDWYRLTVPLKCKQIWGYWLETDGKSLSLVIRRPPAIAAEPASPLRGLLFALEAGHGGSSDGAVGHMGTKEKDVNAAAVAAFKGVLEGRGATTVVVRPGDTNPTLAARVEAANEVNANFYVAIHANAAGNGRGFLKISGTSTYYRDKHCRLLAQLVYNGLLGLGWNEFGVVGNFSYSPLQNTKMPSILIEQAFMSNPADEARLLDSIYQEQQAQAVADSLEQFLRRVRE
ncbi:MAG: N-acetylmuramoyl-L-alanine amidase [Phycisphaerae bacterium]|nr:N-acetylmuramoyl-L-alanine amidase [Phycisphaerae bacterium]